jgi:hypothetical protein
MLGGTEAASRPLRGVAFAVHLQRGSDEQINRIPPGELRQYAVRP